MDREPKTWTRVNSSDSPNPCQHDSANARMRRRFFPTKSSTPSDSSFGGVSLNALLQLRPLFRLEFPHLSFWKHSRPGARYGDYLIPHDSRDFKELRFPDASLTSHQQRKSFSRSEAHDRHPHTRFTVFLRSLRNWWTESLIFVANKLVSTKLKSAMLYNCEQGDGGKTAMKDRILSRYFCRFVYMSMCSRGTWPCP